jgi:hypothetical protein
LQQWAEPICKVGLALTADDVEWIVPGEWPLAGTQCGHAGLALARASGMAAANLG